MCNMLEQEKQTMIILFNKEFNIKEARTADYIGDRDVLTYVFCELYGTFFYEEVEARHDNTIEILTKQFGIDVDDAVYASYLCEDMARDKANVEFLKILSDLCFQFHYDFNLIVPILITKFSEIDVMSAYDTSMRWYRVKNANMKELMERRYDITKEPFIKLCEETLAKETITMLTVSEGTKLTPICKENTTWKTQIAANTKSKTIHKIMMLPNAKVEVTNNSIYVSYLTDQVYIGYVQTTLGEQVYTHFCLPEKCLYDSKTN